MKVLAYEEAAGHYQRALQALDLQAGPDAAERCDLLLALAEARMAAGEPEEARAQYQQAAGLARRLGDGARLARAAFGLGREFTAGTVDELEVGLLEETLAVLGSADSALRARVLARLAKALASSPDPDRRAQLSRTAVAMARRLGDPATLAAVLYDHHMATWGPDNLEERLAVATEVVELAEAGGDQVMALQGRGFLMADQLEQGDLTGLERAWSSTIERPGSWASSTSPGTRRSSGPARRCSRAASTRRNAWPPRRSPWDGGPTTRWSPSTTRSC
jgi:tetratricopeptide (TPR) repeat protein